MAKDDNTSTQTVYTREPEWMEAYRRALLEDAQSLISRKTKIPEYRVAGMSPEQKRAIVMASQGVGSYKPFLKTAGGLYGEAAKDYRGLTGYGDRGVAATKAGRDIARGYIGKAGGAYGESVKDISRGIGKAQGYLGRAGSGYESAVGSVAKGMQSAKGYLQEARGGYRDVGGYAEDALGLSVAGTEGYDPRSVREFMDPYQEAVTANVMKNLRRETAIQKRTGALQAASAGAFGGSRFAVQEAEMGRNLADVQGQTLASQRSANYSQAQQAAMNAFQNQQARMQQAGQTALGAGQLQAQGASGIASLGAQEYGMGQGLAQQQFQSGQGMAALGGQEYAMGQGLANQRFQMGQGMAGLAGQEYGMGQGVGQAELSAGQLQATGAAGLSNLGQQQSALGQQTSALGQGDTSFLYNMGLNLQGQNQKQLEAQRMNEQLYAAEPYTRMSYYADLLNRTPSGQMQTSQTTSPAASPWSQILGLGTTALAAYNLYNKQY